MNRILEELPLVFVLLLNARVDTTILRLLVLDEIEKALVHGNFQLLVIISVLDHLVHRILKVVDVRIIFADQLAVLVNRLLNRTLSQT